MPQPRTWQRLPRLKRALSARLCTMTLVLLTVCAGLAVMAPAAHAQRSADIGLTYTQERSKFANAYCECFPLRGATVDVAADLFHGLGITGMAQGVAASNLRGSIDIQQISFMGGVRYARSLGRNEAISWGRKGSIYVEALGGYTFATSGLYPNSNDTALTNQASALTYMGGGGINFHVYHRLDWRLIQADYVISDLPNGGNNQQRTLRLASGLNFHIGH
jgi:hypothetical protein